MTTWTAPTSTEPVRGRVVLPGSKSVTARALVLAALAGGPSRVRRPLRARDSLLMAAGLRALGVGVEDAGDDGADDGTDDWTVTPGALTGDADVDCGLSGTVMRFLLAAAPLARGAVRFDGDPEARVRPLSSLAGALRALGADVDGDRLPVTVTGTGRLAGGEVTLDASGSSQFVSALLLAGSRYDGGVTVRHAGPPLPSAPYVTMTLRMLAAAGLDASTVAPGVWRVAPGVPAAADVTVEPDLVNAVPFLAAALLTGGAVTVPGWPAAPLQAGDAYLDVLAALGGTVARRDDDVTVTGGTVHGADLDLRDVSELVPVVAVLACFADGPTRVRGVAHIRGHETDRLTALAAELSGLGGDVRDTADGLEIRPAPLHAGTFRTHGDHRLATAAALAGLLVPGVVLDDVDVTSKTLPAFPALWAELVGGDAAREPETAAAR